jgi:molybdopterin-binding protein
MFAKSCADCRRGFELAERAHADGLTLQGGSISLADVTIDTATANRVVFTTVTSSSAGRLEDSSGKLVQALVDSSNFQIMYQVVRDNQGRWVITSSQVLP